MSNAEALLLTCDDFPNENFTGPASWFRPLKYVFRLVRGIRYDCNKFPSVSAQFVLSPKLPLATVERTIHEITRTNTKLTVLRGFRVASWIVLELRPLATAVR
jgi:hypothetical protein